MKNICIDSISPLGGKIKTEGENIVIDKFCIYCYNELKLRKAGGQSDNDNYFTKSKCPFARLRVITYLSNLQASSIFRGCIFFDEYNLFA